LTPNQATTVDISFDPTAAGAATGQLTIVSNSSNNPTVIIGLSGTGEQAHSAVLSWNASTSSTVTGYNVYRSMTSGNGYDKINDSPIGGLNYTDTTVAGGQTYYYVVTSVDSMGDESAFSEDVPAIIPSP
jgi:fibronectin type 3 domain-containing protein